MPNAGSVFFGIYAQLLKTNKNLSFGKRKPVGRRLKESQSTYYLCVTFSVPAPQKRDRPNFFCRWRCGKTICVKVEIEGGVF